MNNDKTLQHFDSFHLSTEITSEDNLPLQVEEIVSEDTEQSQQRTLFIRNLLDHIINNALSNLEKASDAIKIITCLTNEMPTTIFQQFTWDDTLIPIPNDIDISITENQRRLYICSSIDKSFQ